MGLHTGIDKFITTVERKVRATPNTTWHFNFPNTADFNFNYYKLLSDARESAIAHNQNPNLRIAIVGAGLAGLTAARELFRCGYTMIDLYEASDRIGGRTYSIPLNTPQTNSHTVYEMGAMRIPYFTAPGSRNSVMDYYSSLFQVATQPFPDPGSKVYDAVILTAPTWALQISTDFEGFNPKNELPFSVLNSIKVSHWISSCKVFYPLKERYWGEGKKIPQLISTDTYLQGIYGYAVKDEPGVLLLSYTWEDDANKLLAFAHDTLTTEEADRALAQKCLKELDKLLLSCVNIQTPISPYVDEQKPIVIQWSKKPSYRGCAKLYRETSWNTDYLLLRYNQEMSANSNLYFAGEAFSVEGGWLEPALRSALDAVIHLIENTNGEFLNNFQYVNYPQYDSWSPSFQ